MFNDGYYMGGMHGIWWMIWMVIFVMVFLNWGTVSTRVGKPRDTPHDILKRRLASGAMTPAQYEEHKAILDRDASAPKPQQG